MNSFYVQNDGGPTPTGVFNMFNPNHVFVCNQTTPDISSVFVGQSTVGDRNIATVDLISLRVGNNSLLLRNCFFATWTASGVNIGKTDYFGPMYSTSNTKPLVSRGMYYSVPNNTVVNSNTSYLFGIIPYWGGTDLSRGLGVNYINETGQNIYRTTLLDANFTLDISNATIPYPSASLMGRVSIVNIPSAPIITAAEPTSDGVRIYFTTTVYAEDLNSYTFLRCKCYFSTDGITFTLLATFNTKNSSSEPTKNNNIWTYNIQTDITSGLISDQLYYFKICALNQATDGDNAINPGYDTRSKDSNIVSVNFQLGYRFLKIRNISNTGWDNVIVKKRDLTGKWNDELIFKRDASNNSWLNNS